MDPKATPLPMPQTAPAPTPITAGGAGRRRTLGTCAHCRGPVRLDEEYIRLYRRAWHLECALASGPSPEAAQRA